MCELAIQLFKCGCRHYGSSGGNVHPSRVGGAVVGRLSGPSCPSRLRIQCTNWFIQHNGWSRAVEELKPVVHIPPPLLVGRSDLRLHVLQRHACHVSPVRTLYRFQLIALAALQVWLAVTALELNLYQSLTTVAAACVCMAGSLTSRATILLASCTLVWLT